MKRILYLVSEQWPSHRADFTVLFGKYLPRHGIFSDIVTEADAKLSKSWQGGDVFLCKPHAKKIILLISKFCFQTKTLLNQVAFTPRQQYQAVQVRDMIWIALIALPICKWKKLPFYYWLSYPHSEGQIDRAKARGIGAGVKFFGPMIQGVTGRYLLYRWVLPYTDHIFVQSPVMQQMLEKKGIAASKITPVLMGVDTELLETAPVPIDDNRLSNKRVLAYLGTLDRARKIEILFEMMAIIKQVIPDALLVLVGDTEDTQHRQWLQSEVSRLGIESHVLFTGWLSTDTAWRYVSAAEIGLSPIPRGHLLDMGSPTKAIEYMAIGIPTVMNDNPDQAQCALESQAGICVPLTAQHFAHACIELLENIDKRNKMAVGGKPYVIANRSYQNISDVLSKKYLDLLINKH